MSDMTLVSLPTTIALVDDHGPFVRDLAIALSSRFPLIRTFTNPKEGLAFIHRFGITSPLSPAWYTSSPAEEVDEISDVRLFLERKYFSVHKKVYKPNRFIANNVVIVDYQMSGMNGIEFCKAIENPFVKKILLTGVADSDVGMEAMNRGLIDHYVSKHNPRMIKEIVLCAETAQQQSFREMSDLLHELVRYEEGSCISDPIHKQLVREYKAKTRAVEAYVCDPMGSMIFVGANGEVSSLWINTKEQLDLNYELAAPEISCSHLREDLRTYEKMICCPKPEGFITAERASIEKYIYRAHRVEGKRLYYYAFDPLLFDVDQSAIRSYNVFLDENEDLLG